VLTALALVAFSGWCYVLVGSLQESREAIARRGDWLSAWENLQLASSEQASETQAALAEVRAATEALRQERDQAPLLRAALASLEEELEGALDSQDVARLQDTLRLIESQLHHNIAQLVSTLGARWDSLQWMVLAAMTLAASNLVLLLLTQRDARRLKALSGDLSEQFAQRASAEAAREAVERSRRELRQLIERLHDGVALLREGKVLYANPALVEMLGAKSPEALGESGLPEPLVVKGRANSGEHSLQKAKGPLVLEVRADEEIEFEGVPATVLVARDVTQERHMQARLRLTDRLASVGTLAAGVAHEINNPLAYVSANLSFLSRELPGNAANEKLRDALRDAREGVRRVEQIVRDIKTFSRSDEQSRPTDVTAVLRSALNISRRELTPKAKLSEEYQPNLPSVLASEARLGQVFLNLLLNAAQAIPEGAAEQHQIRVRVRRSGERIEVSIRDTGGGIPKEILGRIFDPFFTTKPVGVGTGLGLSICHSIVTSMGGELQVESEPGAGSTFRVLLPSSSEPARNLPRASPSEEIHRTPVQARILVVDDEPSILTALRRLLARHELTTCGDGKQALQLLLGGGEFDLVLCDLMMPGLTGVELYEEVSQARPEYEPRFLFMTGGAFHAAAQDILDRLPERCIGKPLDLERLLAMIRERLDARPLGS
jgi:signal transduction histidine kinase/ActR/RegA family two-component response regulator